ncbi:DUF2783 domain-containing protein [Roseateles sp.]|uniref:DUF2783 domain-containing protein n=1 Tax=Roseateles sp. TaxID=1971397 RepID=UPI0031D6D134
MSLITAPNLEAGDDFYEALLAAHHGLDAGASAAFNARLILLMANHIGRQDVLLDALAAASRANPLASAGADTAPNAGPGASALTSASTSISIAPTPGPASPRGQA